MTITVVLEAKEGREEELKRELLAVLVLARQEEGCTNYDLHQHANNPAIFLIYENWRSKADFENHQKKPYVQALSVKFDDLLSKSILPTFYQMVSDYTTRRNTVA